MNIEEPQNPLISSSKSSDSRLQVQLHPLVILTISDYITRHILRGKSGPLVGAVIGTQDGRDITMEHAFDCKTEIGQNGQDVLIDAGWFHDRLQQYRDVHKAPALDLVGWFTLTPPSGPQPEHVSIHQQILQNHNESALLLAFHPTSIANKEARGGKLPLVVYETIYEAAAPDEDEQMQAPGDARPQLSLKFQELPYIIETGEAEMIAVDFVARGSGSARALNGGTSSDSNLAETEASSEKGKGKALAAPQSQANGRASSEPAVNQGLSAEDEDLIASLTAKANAIQMLQERIRLMKLYLTSLPPCHVNQPQSDPSNPAQISPNSQIPYPVLRQINSLLARLPLLTPISTPSQTNQFPSDVSSTVPVPEAQNDTPFISPHTHDRQTQQTDTQLVALLSKLGSTLNTASGLGKKFQVYETARNLSHSQRRGFAQMPVGFDQDAFGDAFSSRAISGKSNGSALGGRSGASMPSNWGLAGGGAGGEFFADGAIGGDLDDDMNHPEDWEEGTYDA